MEIEEGHVKIPIFLKEDSNDSEFRMEQQDAIKEDAEVENAMEIETNIIKSQDEPIDYQQNSLQRTKSEEAMGPESEKFEQDSLSNCFLTAHESLEPQEIETNYQLICEKILEENYNGPQKNQMWKAFAIYLQENLEIAESDIPIIKQQHQEIQTDESSLVSPSSNSLISKSQQQSQETQTDNLQDDTSQNSSDTSIIQEVKDSKTEDNLPSDLSSNRIFALIDSQNNQLGFFEVINEKCGILYKKCETYYETIKCQTVKILKVVDQTQDCEEELSHLNGSWEYIRSKSLNHNLPQGNQWRMNSQQNESIDRQNQAAQPCKDSYNPSCEPYRLQDHYQVNDYEQQETNHQGHLGPIRNLGRNMASSVRSVVNSFSFSSSSQGFGLKNYGTNCFMNALFQCLYQVDHFREEIIEKRDIQNIPFIRNMGRLFHQMKNRDENREFRYLYEYHEKLIREICNTRKEFKIDKPGDSSILLRAIFEVLSKDSSLEKFSHTRMFAGGSLKKMLKCGKRDCNQEEKIIYAKMEILEVRDINFFQENQEIFFQSLREKRTCPCNKTQNDFACSYAATSLPEILVIRIQDTINSGIHVKIIQELILQQSEGDGKQEERVRYELISGVLNNIKGENGQHSIALSYEKDSYYIYNDDNPKRELSFNDVNRLNKHPKLLFYRKL